MPSPKHTPSVDEVVAELRKHDAAMTAGEWHAGRIGAALWAVGYEHTDGGPLHGTTTDDVGTVRGAHNASGIAYLRNHASLIADLLAEKATERERVLREAVEKAVAEVEAIVSKFDSGFESVPWRRPTDWRATSMTLPLSIFADLRAALPTDTEGGSK